MVIFVGCGLVASSGAGKGGGGGGVGYLLCCGDLGLFSKSCVLQCKQPSAARALGQLSVCEGVRHFLAPPSSVLRLNPSVLIPKEGDHLRSPFQATIACDLTMLPQPMIVVGRNVIV